MWMDIDIEELTIPQLRRVLLFALMDEETYELIMHTIARRAVLN